MNNKILFISLIVIAFVAGAVALFFRAGNKGDFDISGDSVNLIISDNAIYVSEQKPGKIVLVSLIQFEKPGFVVIHEDNAGVPGKILGVSNLLARGETKNLPPITLSRETKDGEVIYAMLHFDNGDDKFDAANDKPVLDKVGNEPMMTIAIVSEDAVESGIVNP